MLLILLCCGMTENMLSNSLCQESRVPEGLSGKGGVLGYCLWEKMFSFIHSINPCWELTEWMQEGRNGAPEINWVLCANAFQGKYFLIEMSVPSLSKTLHFLFHTNTFTNEYCPVCGSLSLQVFKLWLTISQWRWMWFWARDSRGVRWWRWLGQGR